MLRSVGLAWLSGLAPSTASGKPRDPLLQPFASSSIWNLPVGSGAIYEPSWNSRPPGVRYGYGIGDDHDVIILTPEAPLTEVRHNTVGWSCHDAYWNSTAGRVMENCTGIASRCYTKGPVLFKVPMPADFVVPGDGGNNGMAAIMPDRRTIVQGQPFARCAPGAPATVMGGCLDSNNACRRCTNPMGHNETTCIGYGCVANVDLYGDGILGSHGGSGLSCLGGSIRKGEFMPGSPHVRHALKVDVRLTYCSPNEQSCRWPSKSWPSCMSPKVCTSKYATANGTKEASFLAIPPSVATELHSTLQTELGQRMLWTLTNYGAYVVDGGAGSFNMAFEAGPSVNRHASVDSWQSAAAVIAEAYNLTDGSDRQPPNWKFTALRVDRPGSKWSHDVDALERALHVVTSWDNETYARVAASDGAQGAGGGPPLQPWAPELEPSKAS
jgi:hypothetical protein